MTEIRTSAQRTRDKIRTSHIVNKLVAHVKGEIEMSSTQVQAARILLNKVLPDLKALEVDVHAQLKTVSTVRLTDDQLHAIAAQGIKPEAIEGECESVQEPLMLNCIQI